MRIGMIGSGFISDAMLDAISHYDHSHVTAYYSRDLARAQMRAKPYGAVAFDDLETFAASDCFDVCYLASPNSAHMAQSILLMNHGKHVLCEKSMAANLHELREMYEVADRNHVILLEAMRPAFHPRLALIKQHMARLGTIRRVSLHYHQYSSRYDRFKAGIVDNAFDPACGGGALMDIGIYCAAMLILLFGPPQSLVRRSMELCTGIDGQGYILAEYPDMFAELSYSKISNGYVPSCIQGEDGSLLLPHVSRALPMTLKLRNGEEELIPIPALENDMVYELEAIRAMIVNPNLERPHRKRTIETMKLLDAARQRSSFSSH